MNEDVKSTSVHIHSRADELIACLEGEIAKRDARIVELERYDEAVERAAFEAWHKDRYPAVKIRVQNLLGTYTNMQVECNFETWLACAESHSKRFGGALLDANARLNGPPVSEAKARGVVMLGRDAIREVFMRNGFTIKEGQADLKPYVYAAAEELLRLAAPIQQVSVPDGWKLVPVDPTCQMTLTGQKLRYDSVNSIGEIYRQMLAAAPAAPAADAGLVEALEKLARLGNGDKYGNSEGNFIAQAALAAHRAQGVV